MKLKIYTDGSTKNNGQQNAIGGWAYIILKDEEILHQENGYQIGATNQQMELLAALKACIYCLNEYNDPFNEYIIYSDSAYLVNCANQKWYYKWLYNGWMTTKGEPVTNKSYWEQLIPYFESYQFNFHKVKGHSNDKYNNMVDELAQKTAEERREK